MKFRFNILLALCLLIFVGCVKDLDRDNPLDEFYGFDGVGVLSVASHLIESDNNYDHIANPGESIKLNIKIRNATKKDVNGVNIKISTNSPYVSNIENAGPINLYEDGWSSAFYISKEGLGEVNSASSYFGFDIAPNTPIGTILSFNVILTDESGETWNDIIEITVIGVDGHISVKSFEVYSDNNYDKKVNKGETINLKVILENLGSSKLNQVKATFSTNNQYITNLVNHQNISYYEDGWSSADYILAGSTGEVNSSNQHFGFDVDENTPDGTIIVFNVNSIDETGSLWTDTFSIKVEKTDAFLIVQSHDISFDDNYNNKANSGESVRLNVQIKNEGTSRALGVKTSITTESNHITNMVRNNLISYYDDGWSSANYILPGSYGETGSSSSNFGFDVKENTPLGSVITFNVTITDETNNLWNDSFNIIVE